MGLRTDARINAFGTIQGMLLAGTDAGIYWSRDGGASWLGSNGVVESGRRITCIEVVGSTAFAGTVDKGLLEYEVGGRAWRINASFPAKWVRSLKGHSDQLYVGTDREGVYATMDAGKHWRALTHGLPVHAQVFSLTHAGGQVFAGLYSNGLMRWSEADLRWEKAGRVTPLALASNEGTVIAGHNPGGLHWSADLGATWSAGTPSGSVLFPVGVTDSNGELPVEAPVWELSAADGLVVAGAASGVYYSEDSGRTWTRALFGIRENSPGIAFHVERGFMLAAVSSPARDAGLKSSSKKRE